MPLVVDRALKQAPIVGCHFVRMLVRRDFPAEGQPPG